MLRERDTISDFIGYLNGKEQLLRQVPALFAAGEEELLAVYLDYSDRFSAEAFPGRIANESLMIPEGYWGSYAASSEYLARKDRERTSYQWDTLVTSFANDVVTGEMLSTDNSDVKRHEERLRILASPSRADRIVLARCLKQMIAETSHQMRRFRAIVPDARGRKVAYLFLLEPRLGGAYQEYRTFRQTLLSTYAMAFLSENRHLEQVVAVATESPGAEGASYDIVALDGTTWTDDDSAQAAALVRASRVPILTRVRYLDTFGNELPQSRARKAARNRRKGRHQRRRRKS